MIYFTLRSLRNPTLTVDAEWHVGELVTLATIRDKCAHNAPSVFECIEIQADGHELSLIERKFTNLPMVSENPAVVWTGDHAKFILNNLLAFPLNTGIKIHGNQETSDQRREVVRSSMRTRMQSCSKRIADSDLRVAGNVKHGESLSRGKQRRTLERRADRRDSGIHGQVLWGNENKLMIRCDASCLTRWEIPKGSPVVVLPTVLAQPLLIGVKQSTQSLPRATLPNLPKRPSSHIAHSKIPKASIIKGGCHVAIMSNTHRFISLHE